MSLLNSLDQIVKTQFSITNGVTGKTEEQNLDIIKCHSNVKYYMWARISMAHSQMKKNNNNCFTWLSFWVDLSSRIIVSKILV